MSNLLKQETIFFSILIALSLSVFFLLHQPGLISQSDFGWLIFASGVVATIISDLYARSDKTVWKLLRSFVTKFLSWAPPLLLGLILVSSSAVLKINFTGTVQSFPLAFSLGTDSQMVGGQILGANNLTFTAQTFPTNSTLLEFRQVVNLTNHDQYSRSFILHFYNEQSSDLRQIRLFEVTVATADGRRFLLFQVSNGVVTSDESVGMLMPSISTWSMGMSSQTVGSPTISPISLKFDVRIVSGSVHTEGMNIAIDLVFTS